MVKKTYNPRYVRPKQIKRFRGLVNSEPGMVIADPFVGESENGVSRKIRQLERRSGMTQESDRYLAGINHAHAKPLYFALGEGTRVHVEGRYPGHDQTPIDDISISQFPPYATFPWDDFDEDDWPEFPTFPRIDTQYADGPGKHFAHKVPQECTHKTYTYTSSRIPRPLHDAYEDTKALYYDNWPAQTYRPKRAYEPLDFGITRYDPDHDNFVPAVTQDMQEEARLYHINRIMYYGALRSQILRDNHLRKISARNAATAGMERVKRNKDGSTMYWWPEGGIAVCWHKQRIAEVEEILI